MPVPVEQEMLMQVYILTTTFKGRTAIWSVYDSQEKAEKRALSKIEYYLQIGYSKEYFRADSHMVFQQTLKKCKDELFVTVTKHDVK